MSTRMPIRGSYVSGVKSGVEGSPASKHGGARAGAGRPPAGPDRELVADMTKIRVSRRALKRLNALAKAQGVAVWRVVDGLVG